MLLLLNWSTLVIPPLMCCCDVKVCLIGWAMAQKIISNGDPIALLIIYH